MIIQLARDNRFFLPSVHGTKENYRYQPDEKILQSIKELAYSNKPKTCWVNKIVTTTLASGVCSGISVYSFLAYSGYQFDLDEEMSIVAYQLRTWGRPFVQQSVKSFLSGQSSLLEKLKEGVTVADPYNYPLLVLLPRAKNMSQIRYAHTILPYCIQDGLSQIVIKVYDSNYPGRDDHRVVWDKLSGKWKYMDKCSRQWVLTVNYVGNLIEKVPFII